MTKSTGLASVLTLGFAIACGGGIPSAEQFPHEQAAEGIVEITDALAAGEDPKYKCISAETHASKLTTEEGKQIAAELDKLCGFDTPLASVTAATDKAETARKADPDKAVLSECYSADFKTGMEKLAERGHGSKPEVTALQGRWDKACPPKKS